MGIAIIAKGADFGSKNIGQVTPVNIVELSSLSIVGPDSVNNSAQFEVGYSPSNTTQRGVTWSIKSGSQYATIDANTGELTTLPGADGNSVTIKVTSKAKPSVSATKTVTTTTTTTVYDWNDLLAMNQTSWQAGHNTPNIDGYQYYFIRAADNTKIGQNISAVKGGSQEFGAVKMFKIPVDGWNKVNCPVFKTSSGYGYAFTDNNDVVKGLYTNSSIESGTYQDITVPSGATYLYLSLSNSIYTALGENMVVSQV